MLSIGHFDCSQIHHCLWCSAGRAQTGLCRSITPLSIWISGRVDSRMFDLWDSQSAKIAQLELCVIVMTIASMASELRGHHCLWFVDNIASLMSLIRGRSSTLELDAMTGIVHSMLCGLQCMIYWEWVASADNWSDGVSRDGSADPWLRRHSFTPFLVDPLLLLFQLSPSFIQDLLFSLVHWEVRWEFGQSIGCRPMHIGVDLHRLHVACRAMKPEGFPPTAL